MGRLNVSQLPWPQTIYRIDLLPAPPPDHRGRLRKEFESWLFSVAEDEGRRSELLKAKNQPGLFQARSAHKLARKLRRRRLARTPASSRYMRLWRRKLVGATWRLIAEGPWNATVSDQVSVFSAVNRTWTFTPAELRRANAAKLMRRFRTDLNRAGAAAADGFLIGFLHGEWEPNEGVYRLHVHGVAAGGMIAVVRGLKHRKHYRRDTRAAVVDAVKVSRKLLEHLPFAISYQFKSYWPQRWIGWSDKASKVVRQRHGQRIKEPHHTQVLLWLDRWSLEDLSLLMKVRVGPEGFVLTSQLTVRDQGASPTRR